MVNGNGELYSADLSRMLYGQLAHVGESVYARTCIYIYNVIELTSICESNNEFPVGSHL